MFPHRSAHRKKMDARPNGRTIASIRRGISDRGFSAVLPGSDPGSVSAVNSQSARGQNSNSAGR